MEGRCCGADQSDLTRKYNRIAGPKQYARYFASCHYAREHCGDNLILVSYESLYRNREKAFARLCAFLVGDLLAQAVADAVALTGIESMESRGESAGPAIVEHSGQVAPAFGRYVRDGFIGQWGDVLSREDVEHVFNVLADYEIDRSGFVLE